VKFQLSLQHMTITVLDGDKSFMECYYISRVA